MAFYVEVSNVRIAKKVPWKRGILLYFTLTLKNMAVTKESQGMPLTHQVTIDNVTASGTIGGSVRVRTVKAVQCNKVLIEDIRECLMRMPEVVALLNINPGRITKRIQESYTGTPKQSWMVSQ